MATTNSQYVSSVLFLDNRELLNQVLDIHNEQYSFLDIMELSGRSEVTSNSSFYYMVNEEMYQEVSISNDVVTAGRLRSGDMISTTTPGQILYVKSVSSTGDVELTDLDGTAIAAGFTDTVFPFSNAFGEGSGAQESLNYGFKRYGGQVQIFKGKYSITDVAKTQKMAVKVGGSEYYMYKGQHDALQRFRNDISLALMFGQKNDTKFHGIGYNLNGGTIGNPIAATGDLRDSYGNKVQTASGLDEIVENEGISFNNGAFSLNTMATFTKQLDTIRAPHEYCIFLGSDANIQMENVLNGLTSYSGGAAGTNADTSMATSGRRQFSGSRIDLGVDSFKMYGRTYHKKYLPMIEHAAGQALLGANASSTAYFCPMDGVKVQHGGGTQNRMMVRYLAGDGTDLKYKEIVLGGLAPNPNTDELKLEFSYSSAQGLQLLGTNVFAKATFA